MEEGNKGEDILEEGKSSECEGRRGEGMRVLGLTGGWDSKFDEPNETIGAEPGTRRESTRNRLTSA